MITALAEIFDKAILGEGPALISDDGKKIMTRAELRALSENCNTYFQKKGWGQDDYIIVHSNERHLNTAIVIGAIKAGVQIILPSEGMTGDFTGPYRRVRNRIRGTYRMPLPSNDVFQETEIMSNIGGEFFGVLYSGGTTAKAKPSYTTTQNLVVRFARNDLVFGFQKNDIVMSLQNPQIVRILPNVLNAGGTMSWPGVESFRPNWIADAVENVGVTLLNTQGNVIDEFVGVDIDMVNFSTVRKLFVSSSPLNPEAFATIRKLLPANAVIEYGYGMSEAGILCKLTEPEMTQRPGSVGRIMPDIKYKIQNGELVIKGPSVAPRYYGGRKIAGRNGWFKTGDLVTEDAAGYVTITGRKDN